MFKSLYFIIIPIVLLVSCKGKNKGWYQEDEICECYTQTEFIGFDNTLSSCSEKFFEEMKNQRKNESDKEFEKLHVFQLTSKLIKTCPKFQKDFNTVLLNRYSKRNKENLSRRKDSLLNLIDSTKNKAGRYIQLSELEIINGEFDNAFESVNKSIDLNPNMEMSYFVRGYLNHKNGKIDSAISDIKEMRELTKQSDLKSLADLWILNLEQELK